jgi:tetratricopeptide (TPR) repeat protein
MLRKEMTKVEIEKELMGKGDYVLIDNMTRFLKENLPVDIKRFVYLKLVAVYERRSMFADAAAVYDKLIEISMTPTDKTVYRTKATECYIKAGFFDKADLSMKNLSGEAKLGEKAKINSSIKDFYLSQAQTYEKEKRRAKAIQTYQRILTLNLLDVEKDEINKKLLTLYKETGMIKEFMDMKKKLGI